MKSLILDTNTILRFLIGDVPSQQKIASEIFKKIESKKIYGMISILVINETFWALEKFYDRKSTESVEIVRKILSLKNIKIIESDKETILDILDIKIDLNIDFTDAYLLWIKNKEKYEISTFDKKLLKNL